MSGKKPAVLARVELCDECRYDGGTHWTDDLVPKPFRPHHDQARLLEEARELSALANKEASETAKQIVREAARRYGEFSGNDVRPEMKLAGVPGGCIGAAFHAVSMESDSCIEHTGRHELSNEAHVRHRIGIWRSKVYRGAA